MRKNIISARKFIKPSFSFLVEKKRDGGEFSDAEIRYIVDHCGARVLLIDPEIEEDMASVECEFKYTISDDTDNELFVQGVDPIRIVLFPEHHHVGPCELIDHGFKTGGIPVGQQDFGGIFQSGAGCGKEQDGPKGGGQAVFHGREVNSLISFLVRGIELPVARPMRYRGLP